MKKQIPISIQGPNEKTWNKPAFSLTLDSDNMKYFVALYTNNAKYDWFLHFENEGPNPYTPEEKQALFTALAANISDGDIVTTEGGVTPGGISAFKTLKEYGFEVIGKHSGTTHLWWANRLLDEKKFNSWLEHADSKDYKIIDKTKPLSKDNTIPVVLVLKRNKKYDKSSSNK